MTLIAYDDIPVLWERTSREDLEYFFPAISQCRTGQVIWRANE